MLPQKHRLAHSRDIQLVSRTGRMVRSANLTLRHGSQRNGKRFAYVVSTKVSKKATVRNRLKRQLRALTHTHLGVFPDNRDYLFIVRPTKPPITFTELKREFMLLLEKF